MKVIFALTFRLFSFLSRHACAYFNVSFAVVQVLNENSPIGGWVLFRIVNTAMFSSREKKTAWVFRR